MPDLNIPGLKVDQIKRKYEQLLLDIMMLKTYLLQHNDITYYSYTFVR